MILKSFEDLAAVFASRKKEVNTVIPDSKSSSKNENSSGCKSAVSGTCPSADVDKEPSSPLSAQHKSLMPVHMGPGFIDEVQKKNILSGTVRYTGKIGWITINLNEEIRRVYRDKLIQGKIHQPGDTIYVTEIYERDDFGNKILAEVENSPIQEK